MVLFVNASIAPSLNLLRLFAFLIDLDDAVKSISAIKTESFLRSSMASESSLITASVVSVVILSQSSPASVIFILVDCARKKKSRLMRIYRRKGDIYFFRLPARYSLVRNPGLNKNGGMERKIRLSKLTISPTSAKMSFKGRFSSVKLCPQLEQKLPLSLCPQFWHSFNSSMSFACMISNILLYRPVVGIY